MWLDDLIIGAPYADVGGDADAGETYMVYGSSNGFSAAGSLSALDGTNGFSLTGIDAFDQSGYSVSGAGDINGDGLDDLLIGAPKAASSAGESYVIYGSSGGGSATLNLSTLNGANGFTITGIDSFDWSGVSVSGAGDVNGDGLDDLIIGAFLADPGGKNSAGESYVVYGSSGEGGVSPVSGSPAGGYTVVISGQNLGDGSDVTNVTLNGTPVRSIDSQSATEIVVTAGARTVGTGDVVVYSSSLGTTTKENGFSYIYTPGGQIGDAPGVSPDSGPVAGGTTVTISGVNLGDGTDVMNVTLCGVPVAAIVSQSSTQIVVTAAAGVAGTGDVMINSASYGPITKINGFTYVPPLAPTIGIDQSDVLITFDAVSGWTYYIQYTGDLVNGPWKTVHPGIVASNSTVQWVDSGPPATEALPAMTTNRFYRIQEIR